MVYTLNKGDQRCDVTYIDWSKTYSSIPKATCKTIRPKCSNDGYDDAVELKCEDLKKLIHGEDKSKEDDSHTEDNKEFSILGLMPKVEGKFSSIGVQDGIVRYVADQSPEQKETFEREIITTLKGKLPAGAVVEAVLGEPYYKVNSKLVEGKTNYILHVRVTLKGKVYEQEYNVPHIEDILVADQDSF